MLFSLLALTGCTPDTDTEPATAGTTPATDPADPGDWLPTYVPPDLTPAWSADEALAALTSGLALARPDPWQMAAAFDYFLSQGNDWCPGESTILSTEAIEGCAAEGWFYLGIGGYSLYEDPLEEGLRHSLYQIGDLQIVGGPERLEVGGHWSHVQQWEDAVGWFEGELTGSWWSPSSSDVAWLEAGTSAWLKYGGLLDTETGQRLHVSINGGLTVGDTSLSFRDMIWDADVCDQAATGAVSWLDPQLGWWSLALTDCTGCGPLEHEGVPVQDQACVDLDGYGDAIARWMRP